jgi:hypothetical protein
VNTRRRDMRSEAMVKRVGSRVVDDSVTTSLSTAYV